MSVYEKEVERLRSILEDKDRELCEIYMKNNEFRALLMTKPLIGDYGKFQPQPKRVSSGWTPEGGYKVMIAIQNMFLQNNPNVEKL